MTELLPCMGGWCTLRGSCGHYHSNDRRTPSERLCAPHDSLYRGWVPVQFGNQPLARDFVVQLVPSTTLMEAVR